MLLVTAILRAYARKNTCKFDKLRDPFYVHSKPTFTGEQSRQIRPIRRPDPEPVGDRYDTPIEYVSEWEVFRMLDNLQPTAAGLDGPPAWFLRRPCKTIAYLFNTSLAIHPQSEAVERSYKIRPLYLKYQYQSNTLTTVQPLSHQLCPD